MGALWGLPPIKVSPYHAVCQAWDTVKTIGAHCVYLLLFEKSSKPSELFLEAICLSFSLVTVDLINIHCDKVIAGPNQYVAYLARS